MRLIIISVVLLLTACRASSGSGPDGVLDAQADQATEDGGIITIDPDGAVDAEPNSLTIGVATYNVHRFFDTVCDSGHCEPDDYELQLNTRDFDVKAEDVARAVLRLHAEGAQVVMLQEVETDLCMDRVLSFIHQLSDEPLPFYVLGETGFSASVDVVVMAWGTHEGTVTHRQDPIYEPDGSRTQFSRELLEVHLKIGEVDVVAFAAHFRSKYHDDPARRVAEARATREIMHQVALDNPESLVVLGGDLNDTPGSDTINDLEEEGYLYRVAQELGDGDATYFWNGDGDAIDHLYHAVEANGRYIVGSANVVTSHGRTSLSSSDHAALSAQFEVPPPP